MNIVDSPVDKRGGSITLFIVIIRILRIGYESSSKEEEFEEEFSIYLERKKITRNDIIALTIIDIFDLQRSNLFKFEKRVNE